MRISTAQIYAAANRNMLEGQAKLAETQGKIATGKNFTTLAEDPVGANQVVTLRRELAQLDMFQTNIDATRRRLALEDTTLREYTNALDRARVLMVQGANGTLTDNDRKSISYELEEITEFMAGLMNTRDAKGEYLFAGSQGTEAAYALQNGRYSFQGDANERTIQVASGVYLDSTDSGQKIFESIKEAPAVATSGPLAGAILDTEVTNASEYAALVRSAGDIRLRVDQVEPDPLIPSDTGLRYSLLDSANQPLTDKQGQVLLAVPYLDSEAAPEELEVALSGVTLTLALPLGADLTAKTVNEPLELRLSGIDAGILAGVDIQDEAQLASYIESNGNLQLVSNYDAGAGTYTWAIEDALGTTLESGTSASNELTVSPAGMGVTLDLVLPFEGPAVDQTLYLAAPDYTALTGSDKSILQNTAVRDAALFTEFMLENTNLQLSSNFDSDTGVYSWQLTNGAGALLEEGSYREPTFGVLTTADITLPLELPAPGQASFQISLNGVRSQTLTLQGDGTGANDFTTESDLVNAVQALVDTDPMLVEAGMSVSLTDGQLSFTVEDGSAQLGFAYPDAVASASLGVLSNQRLINVEAAGASFRLELPMEQADYSESIYLNSPDYAVMQLEQLPSNPVNAILDAIDALRTPLQGDTVITEEFNAQMALVLDQLLEAQERVSESSADIGARLNSLDSVELSNTDFRLMTEGTLSSIQDLDYAAASTELAKRQLALEASYASFAKIQGLSLFNYIN